MFADPFFWLAYVVAAGLVALLGYGRRMGVLGFFILSLMFTPTLVLLVLIVTRPKLPRREAPSSRS